MFRFDSADGAKWEPAAGMSLQMFDVGSGSVVGFSERSPVHGKIAAHELIAFCGRFVDGAREPVVAHLHFALLHHRRFLLGTL
jgi:hypothetical protein